MKNKKVRFYLSNSKLEKSALIARISMQQYKQPFSYSTGITLSKEDYEKYYNQKECRFLSRSPFAHYNPILSNYESKILEIYRRHEINKTLSKLSNTLFKSELFFSLNGDTASNQRAKTLIWFFTYSIESRIGLADLSEPTLERYETVLNAIKKMLAHYKMKDIELDNINVLFFNQLLTFLTKEMDYKHSSLKNFKSIFCKILKLAFKQGYTSNQDYINFELPKLHKRVNIEHVYLTRDEINAFVNYDTSDMPLLYQQCQDIAHVMLIVGCRVSDYLKVCYNNVAIIRGVKHIKFETTKRGIYQTVPLTEELKNILDKYKGRLPSMTTHQLNGYMKNIARLSGINELVRNSNIRAKAKIELIEKWSLVSPHTCRRTVVTLMLKDRRFTDFEIMAWVGMARRDTLQRYFSMTAEEISESTVRKLNLDGILKAV